MKNIGGVDVSRETFDQLETFVALVEKWTPKINLISKSSIPQIWDRHIADSAQIFDLAPTQGHWLDIGSGGGFPGIVVAILSKGGGFGHRFTLIESDQRKCAFLRTASRELSLNIDVLPKRIEDVTSLQADVLTARALTDLTALLGFGDLHLKSGGTAIFPKGMTWQNEHTDAQNRWSYQCEAIKSVTNPAAAVLKIQDIVRV
jgi:16S rRNA (guanine527-N7)-methyltransferase